MIRTTRCTRFVRGLLTLAAPAAVALCLSNGPGAAGAQPATEPAAKAAAPTSQAVQERIERAVRELGADDFRAREKAADELWSLGDAAVPALKEAAAGDDPEAARRARDVLDRFAYGIRPDTPRAVMNLLDQYRGGSLRQRQAAVAALAQLDVPGARVLLRIARDERDEWMRRAAAQALSRTSRPVAARLMAGGEFDVAKQLLQTCAPEGAPAARDYAAFLLLRGGVDQEVGRLEAELKAAGAPGAPQAGPPPPPAPQPPGVRGRAMPAPAEPAPRDGREVALQLAFLHRAKGDLAAARSAAEKSPDPQLPDALLVETGDWKALAARAEQGGLSATPVEQMAYAAAFHRLAGDADAAGSWAAKLAAYGGQTSGDHWNAAEALLINDRPDEAIEVLLKGGNYLGAADFMIPRLQFKEALALLDRAKADAGADAGGDAVPLALRLRMAGPMHFLGRSDEAREMVTAAANQRDEGGWDFATYLQIIEAGRAAAMPREQTDAWCAAAASIYRPQPRETEGLPRLFDRAGFERHDEAAAWWRALRDQHGGESPKQTLARVRRLDRREVAGDELRALCDEVLAVANNLPNSERDPRAVLVADTLAAAGLAEHAVAAMEKVVSRSPTPPVLLRLGDLYAERKDWAKAADAYNKAWEQDRGGPLALCLRGWATVQSGAEKEGRGMIELAHLLPLADEEARRAFSEELSRRGRKELKEEAARERELIVKTCEPGAFLLSDVLRRTAQARHEAGDLLGAAAAWDRALLGNLSVRTTFVDPAANLTIPVVVHRIRAVGLVKAGKFDEAVKEAELCFRSCPGDADGQIAVITALDEAGQKDRADALYRRAKGAYEKLARESPESAPANNLLAWLQSTCRRDLDDALARARKAAAKEPASTAVLDTLSEVHFARGEFDEALKLNEKIRAMEPSVEHHHKNHERFKAAKEKGAAPTTGPSAPGGGR